MAVCQPARSAGAPGSPCARHPGPSELHGAGLGWNAASCWMPRRERSAGPAVLGSGGLGGCAVQTHSSCLGRCGCRRQLTCAWSSSSQLSLPRTLEWQGMKGIANGCPGSLPDWGTANLVWRGCHLATDAGPSGPYRTSTSWLQGLVSHPFHRRLTGEGGLSGFRRKARACSRPPCTRHLTRLASACLLCLSPGWAMLGPWFPTSSAHRGTAVSLLLEHPESCAVGLAGPGCPGPALDKGRPSQPGPTSP